MSQSIVPSQSRRRWRPARPVSRSGFSADDPTRCRHGATIIRPHLARFCGAGFTLVELLVVISIIAILAGLGMGTVNGTVKNAKKIQTKNLLHNIASGTSQYLADYQRLPDVFGSSSDREFESTDAVFADYMEALLGIDEESNSRKNVYLTIPTKFLRDTRGNNYELQDSWKKPFYLVMDLDYDDVLDRSAFDELASAPDEVLPPTDGLRGTPAALYSLGPQGKLTEDTKANDIVTTWR